MLQLLDIAGRMSLLKNSASLRIRGIRLLDEGWYVCRVFFLSNEVSDDDDEDAMQNGTWIKLVVTGEV